TSALAILIVLPLDASEGRSHSEVDLSRLLTRLLVEVQAVVEPQRPQRGVEPDPRTRGEPEVGRVERRAEPVRVPGVEEEGEPEVGDERDRDEQLRVEEQLLVAADHVPLGVLGAHRPGPLTAERSGAPEEEPLEDRDLLAAPALGDADLAPDRVHPVEDWQGEEPRAVHDHAIELDVAAEPGEGQIDRVATPTGGLEDTVPGVSTEADVQLRVDPLADLLL